MNDPSQNADLYARHVRFGWWSLLVFLSVGIALEGLHALKLELYLAPANETRRLLWTLAHAHGTLLAILNLVFGVLSRDMLDGSSRRVVLASRCFLGATLLIPAGFFLGGVTFYEGDPSLGVLLVPPGAVLLLVAVLVCALDSSSP